MDNFYIRTEDIRAEDIANIYVETKSDRNNISYLKSNHPILLVGSRGIGKTMLLKVAQNELNKEYCTEKILPVYLSFSKSILVNNQLNHDYFMYWMYSKILTGFRNALFEKGIITSNLDPFSKLFNSEIDDTTPLDGFIELLEASWNSKVPLDMNKIIKLLNISSSNFKILNDIDFIKQIIKTICESYDIKKIIFLFDEACHNFLPMQQRTFFSMFRDLRSAFICCKAAVYPGISYYDTLQTFHDVIICRIERDFDDINYIDNMRDIVRKQSDISSYKNYENNGELFNALIYCASGNPRYLLKSLELANNGKFQTSNINDTIIDFYRVNIWDEHTKLSDIYSGHKELIDSGRIFLEDIVLPETTNKNNSRTMKKTIYFAIHRDSPINVKQAIRILEYTGIVRLHTSGTKVRGEIYDRYMINLGVVVSSGSESGVVTRCGEIFNSLSIKIYTEYGRNSKSYDAMTGIKDIIEEDNINIIVSSMLNKDISNLDISIKQREKIEAIGFKSLKDIIVNSDKLIDAYYIGPVRSKRIYETAYNAVIEYISG